MDKPGPWERFAGRFALALLVGYAFIGVATTSFRAANERYVFPVSMMPMFRGIKPLTAEQKARVEELRSR